MAKSSWSFLAGRLPPPTTARRGALPLPLPTRAPGFCHGLRPQQGWPGPHSPRAGVGLRRYGGRAPF
eukprot:10595917-Alexandrium_andersonii.AAC.1